MADTDFSLGSGNVRPKRIDIISDTHGYLSRSLLETIDGADLLIHAGDITSEADWDLLNTLAPIKGVLGNNDYCYHYHPELKALNRFTYEGLSFAVAHYREDLPVGSVDVAICGHTHRARVVELGRCTVINPGSASYPRGTRGATIARMIVAEGTILSVEIIDL
ncbi:YfcE family phosphodiesterase [Collinsella sp. AGMB00827]|uniref:Phosphoesterase n=1 Tax=Collinsella ureilytica TaxID=2869515 RepID=A0ABS7MK02_9ACTN|nr:YfcE family phosphodiesterase [Collinsella urealyticum]MBY4797612.1 YfcE family phosphodiesterase [Collinsella urealyticum]